MWPRELLNGTDRGGPNTLRGDAQGCYDLRGEDLGGVKYTVNITTQNRARW